MAPSDQRTPDLEVEFTGDVRAPLRARAAVAALFRSCPAQVDDVRLVVSELITNVVMHTPTGGVLRVWLLDGDGWRVEVEDRSDRPVEIVTAEREVGGRGLDLVGLLSERWGTTLLPGGKVVWAERPRSAQGVAVGVAPSAAARSNVTVERGFERSVE